MSVEQNIEENQVDCGEEETSQFAGRLTLVDNFDTLRADWLALEREVNAGPFQTFEWCETWWRTSGSKKPLTLALITGRDSEGKLGFVLPLTLRRAGLAWVAESLGDNNAAHLGPIYKTRYLNALNKYGDFSLAQELNNLLPQIDTFVLNALILGLQEKRIVGNEFSARKTANDISIVHLEPDWDGFDQKHRNSKSRRNERRRENRLKRLGNFEFRVADNKEERSEMFEALLQQKSDWFRNRRIPNIFADKDNLEFLHTLAATEAIDSGFGTLVSGLKVDNRWISLSMGILHRDHYGGLVLSTTEEEARKHSPGNLLITKTMQHCAQNGIRIFNFGAGESDIKAKWADTGENLMLATLPTSLVGRVYEIILQNTNRAKREIKANPALMKRVQYLRALSAK